VARAVSDALGFRLVDEEILQRAAVEAGVDKDIIADLERRKSALAKIRNRLVLSATSPSPEQFMAAFDPVTGGTIGMSLPHSAASSRLSNDELRGLIRSAIDDIAAAGDVVIVAHAASHALARREGVLRVLVTASAATRSGRLSESLGIDTKEADHTVRKGDADRADYLNRFYGIDQELPTHYDLVVNTDTLAPDDAAASIVVLATRRSTPAQ
jgi:cytidylate kinase